MACCDVETTLLRALVHHLLTHSESHTEKDYPNANTAHLREGNRLAHPFCLILCRLAFDEKEAFCNIRRGRWALLKRSHIR
ncbi:hypothetical protein CEXT_179551 [Caerostris extrusa]|uniref:Secreted protein n=1 Tax=Caerostris extrusa TaxID=172846 RepID=A0AAV4PBR0_CAEEX|nr:hypothetical protein CEXT_179551 [Caerostris extrusa]